MKDTSGREWRFNFTAKTIRDLSRETGLSTKSLQGDNSLLQAIGTDQALLLRVLWITIQDQAAKLNVSEDQWLESLDDTAIESATAEWIEAYINFSPPAMRALLRKTFDKTRAKIEATERQFMQALESPETDAAIDEAVTQALSELSGKLAAS